MYMNVCHTHNEREVGFFFLLKCDNTESELVLQMHGLERKGLFDVSHLDSP